MPQVYGYAVFRGIQSFSYLKTFSIGLLLIGAGATTNILGALNGDGYTGAISPLSQLQLHTRSFFCSLPPQPLLPPHFGLSPFPSSAFWQRVYAPRFALHEESRAYGMAAVRRSRYCTGLVGQTIPVITLMKGIPIVGSSIAGALASIELPVAVISSAIFLGKPSP